MSNKTTIINSISESTKLLKEALKLLKAENTDGKQFDYCTSSSLSNKVDELEAVFKSINKIVYQDC